MRVCLVLRSSRCHLISLETRIIDCHYFSYYQTFFISDPNAKDDTSLPARACDACYETVFPLMDPLSDVPGEGISYDGKGSDTIPSLSNLPSWLSMPSLPAGSSPQALMAIDREPSRGSASSILEELPDFGPGDKRARVRMKSPQHGRPRSYHQLLEDFENNDQGRSDVLSLPPEEGEREGEDGEDGGEADDVLDHGLPLVSGAASASSSPKKENTARRNKRFSLPAVAVQTTSVTARTGLGDAAPSGDGPKVNKRFSLLLGGSRNHGIRSHSEMAIKPGKEDYVAADAGNGELGKGIAAGKLSELLNRRKD